MRAIRWFIRVLLALAVFQAKAESDLAAWLRAVGAIEEELTVYMDKEAVAATELSVLAECLERQPTSEHDLCSFEAQKAASAISSLVIVSWKLFPFVEARGNFVPPKALSEQINEFKNEMPEWKELASRLELELDALERDSSLSGGFACSSTNDLSDFEEYISKSGGKFSPLDSLCIQLARIGRPEIDSNIISLKNKKPKFSPAKQTVTKPTRIGFFSDVSFEFSDDEGAHITPGESGNEGSEQGNCTGAGCTDGEGPRGGGKSSNHAKGESHPGPKDYRPERFHEWAKDTGGQSPRPQNFTDDQIKEMEKARVEKNVDAKTKPDHSVNRNKFGKAKRQIDETPKGTLLRGRITKKGEKPVSGSGDGSGENQSIEKRKNALRVDAQRIKDDLWNQRPRTSIQEKAKDIGIASADAARDAAEGDRLDEAEAFLNIAIVMTDFVVDAIPVTSLVKSVFELVTGYSITSGMKLTTEERWFAAVSVLTLGASGMAGAGAKLASKAAKARPLEKALIKELDNVVVKSAEEVNAVLRKTAKYTEDAYKEGTRVYEFTAPVEMHTARVFKDGGRTTGRWTMQPEAIKGLSPTQIAEKFSLPEVPTHVVDVKIPEGTRVRAGTPARVMEGADTKASPRQFEFADGYLDEWFSNARPLE